MNVHVGALALVSRTLSGAIRPVQPLPFREWLSSNIVLVDGPRKGELWTPEDTPYLLEIADCLDLSHPCNEVTVRKSQQTGVSILAFAWCLYLAEYERQNILYAVSGRDALQDANNGKLQPLIDAFQKQTGKRIIRPTIQKSGTGSTIFEKSIVGGGGCRIKLANANTVKDLSGHTNRYGVKDEVSKWETLPNNADPETLFFGRFTAFRRQKNYKIFQLSTPENDSGDTLGDDPAHCRIDRSFIRSDQRYFHITCVECGKSFAQEFDGLQINEAHPHKSEYACPGCGHLISEPERVQAVRAGKYIPRLPKGVREPGFHVDAFISLMMSYEAIAEDHLETKSRGEAGEKDFKNLVLGLPHEKRGNAPDYQRLMERREDYQENVIPAEGLIFVAAADVQHNGLFVEAVAYSPDRQSWTITARFIEGDTTEINGGAWLGLDKFQNEIFTDVYGNDRRIEALAVDAGDGNRVNQVRDWCRLGPNRYAVMGVHGRNKPAISAPKKTSIYKSGRRKRFGSAMAWPVGTWGLKGEFIGNLHKQGIAAGEKSDPPGYCHHGKFLGEEYFKQITAEYFRQEMVNGRIIEEWKPLRRDNHFLDCRIYAMAMAEHLGLSKLRKDAWAALRQKYSKTQTDLFSADSQIAVVEDQSNRVDSETDSQLSKKPAAIGESFEDMVKKWSRRK